MNHKQRLDLAYQSLQGISIGDAFGDSFFGDRDQILTYINAKDVPPTRWEFTDDTVMAIAVFEQLESYEEIRQDRLVQSFAKNERLDDQRGYGATTRRILRSVSEGESWQTAAAAAFSGMGSMGNGAAMRVSPIGAYYFDQLEKVKKHSQLSAMVTHSHLEASVGAMAVGIATALATRVRLYSRSYQPEEFIQMVFEQLPDSDTKAKIRKSMSLSYSYHIDTIRTVLGDGSRMLAQDTVPFCIWCAAHNLQDFESALWKGISMLGDRDTINAIVAGITIMSCDPKTIPAAWQEAVESIETSAFRTPQSHN